jgi:hypothetical protein
MDLKLVGDSTMLLLVISTIHNSHCSHWSDLIWSDLFCHNHTLPVKCLSLLYEPYRSHRFLGYNNSLLIGFQGYNNFPLFGFHGYELCIRCLIMAHVESSHKLLTYLRSWALLEEPPIVWPLKNFPEFYGTRRFNTMFTSSPEPSTGPHKLQITKCSG